MGDAFTLLLVIGCGVLGGLARARIEKPERDRDRQKEQKDSKSEHALSGVVTAVIVVGLLSQNSFSGAVDKLTESSYLVDEFKSLVFVAAVAMAAGLLGQTWVYRVAEGLLIAQDPKLQVLRDEIEQRIAQESRSTREELTILRAKTAVRDGSFETAIRLLEPILSGSDVPARARVLAEIKKDEHLSKLHKDDRFRELMATIATDRKGL